MDDQAGIDAGRALHVQLEVHLDRQPISGRLRSERGVEERFVGWLGFVEALQRLHQRREPSPGGERPAWHT